jgi:hypothetical protein
MRGKKKEEDEMEVGEMRKDERTSRFFTFGVRASPNLSLADQPSQFSNSRSASKDHGVINVTIRLSLASNTMFSSPGSGKKPVQQVSLLD